MRPHCFILTEACSCRLELDYVARKISKIKMPLCWLYGVFGLFISIGAAEGGIVHPYLINDNNIDRIIYDSRQDSFKRMGKSCPLKTALNNLLWSY